MREKRTVGQVSNPRRLRLWHKRDFQDAHSSLHFLWAQRCSPLISRLSRNITREVASYLYLCGLFPGTYGRQLFVVNAYWETLRLVPITEHDWCQTLFADETG